MRDEFINISEAAREVGCSGANIRRWIKQGYLGAQDSGLIKVNRHVLHFVSEMMKKKRDERGGHYRKTEKQEKVNSK